MDRFFLNLGVMLWLLFGVQAFALPAPRPRGWTEADFGGVLSVGLEGHRNFQNGKKQFTSLCSGCHQIGSLGGGSASGDDAIETMDDVRALVDALREQSAAPEDEDEAGDELDASA